MTVSRFPLHSYPVGSTGDWQRPFIVEGFASQLPAYTRWTKGYLAESIGAAVVPVEFHPEPLFTPEIGDAGFPKKNVTMRELIELDEINSSHGWLYAAQLQIHRHLPSLAPDLRSPSWIEGLPYQIAFWMGIGGTGTRLHYDPYDNVMIVIRGAKRFEMFPPGHFGSLYPYKAYSRWGHFSRVNIAQPDRESFPRFPPQGGISCCVHEGDALCIPHGWWHQVTNEETTVAVNYFYSPRFPQTLSPHHIRFAVGKLWRWLHRAR